MYKKAKIILETGQVFEGKSVGYDLSVQGEFVFTTGMTGFELSLTDPSYKGQILVFTFPLIGNFGVASASRDEFGIVENFESDQIHVNAVVCNNMSEDFSHHMAEKSFSDWLKEGKIPAISEIDTRHLTQVLREKGALLGQILIEGDEEIVNLKDPNKKNLVAEVATKEVKIFEPKDYVKTILAIDTGIKNNILRSFLKRGVRVILAPWDFDVANSELEFDGLFLSNGPGDPKVVYEVINKNIDFALSKNMPIFGICLGNQVLSLAMGADTYKLDYGHRGANQPCQDIHTKKCYITSQNHGFCVDGDTVPEDFEIWFKNLNDGSVEGIKHKTKPIYSVQFHPEAFAGPHDTGFLFDEFIAEL
jgi:carbamoyl-phosphate synthase small subunit